MSSERPRLIAQERFLEHRQQLEQLDLPKRFQYIFQHNLWSNEESRSGIGSTMEQTRTLRKEIVALLNMISAKSMLDIPCGDFNWLSQVELGVSYTGADIVPAIIEENQRKFTDSKRQFVCLDATTSALPKADVILCRDCLVHLSNANIDAALNNFRRSGSRYLLMTHFYDVTVNRDIADGDWRAINFTLGPFYLPTPKCLIVENCMEADGAYEDKSLGLWEL